MEDGGRLDLTKLRIEWTIECLCDYRAIFLRSCFSDHFVRLDISLRMHGLSKVYIVLKRTNWSHETILFKKHMYILQRCFTIAILYHWIWNVITVFLRLSYCETIFQELYEIILAIKIWRIRAYGEVPYAIVVWG